MKQCPKISFYSSFHTAEENDEDIDEGMKEYINKQNKLLADKIHSYVIPKERKKYILEELDKLGISQKTLFPEIDHQAKYIINSDSFSTI